MATALAASQLGVLGKALSGHDPSLATPEGWFDMFAMRYKVRGRFAKASLEQTHGT